MAEGTGTGTGTSAGEGTGTGSDDSGTTSAQETSTTGTGGLETSTGTTGGVGVHCNPTDVLCDSLPPQCPPGDVPEVVGGCWGQCVPILECETEPNCDGCQGGICVEYQAFTTDYRCVAPTLMCAALECNCLAPYVCVDPFDGCFPSAGDAAVTCECQTC